MPGGAGEQRELAARLRAVIEAKGAENAVLRAELAVLRESFTVLRGKLDAVLEREQLLGLKVAELERRLGPEICRRGDAPGAAPPCMTRAAPAACASPSARWCLEECGECREGGRVLEQEPVAAFIAVQLGAADARCDVGAVAAGAIPS
jgi:hypothetical protein